MSLILGISTSSPQFEILLGEDANVLYSTNQEPSLKGNKDITAFFNDCLEKCNKRPNEIQKIMVDMGPGGTSVVRTGVAFANGLGYSLGIPVCGVPSLELMGLTLWEQYKMPVVCTVNSIKDNAYLGFYDNKLISMTHGNFEQSLHKIVSEIDEFVIAGYHREKVIALFPNKKIYDSNMQFAYGKTLIEKNNLFANRSLSFPDFANPITEQNIDFYAN